jgi:hypothetical protein
MQLFNAGVSLKLNKIFMIDKATALHDSLLCKAVAATNQKTIDGQVFFLGYGMYLTGVNCL